MGGVGGGLAHTWPCPAKCAKSAPPVIRGAGGGFTLAFWRKSACALSVCFLSLIGVDRVQGGCQGAKACQL